MLAQTRKTLFMPVECRHLYAGILHGWCIGDVAERLHDLGIVLARPYYADKSVAYTASAGRRMSVQGTDVLNSCRLHRIATDKKMLDAPKRTEYQTETHTTLRARRHLKHETQQPACHLTRHRHPPENSPTSPR